MRQQPVACAAPAMPNRAVELSLTPGCGWASALAGVRLDGPPRGRGSARRIWAMSAGLNSQVGLAFGRYAPCARPNLRKPDEQRHGRSASYPGIAEPNRAARSPPHRQGIRPLAPWSRFGSHRSVTRSPATGPRYGHRPRGTARAGALSAGDGARPSGTGLGAGSTGK